MPDQSPGEQDLLCHRMFNLRTSHMLRFPHFNCYIFTCKSNQVHHSLLRNRRKGQVELFSKYAAQQIKTSEKDLSSFYFILTLYLLYVVSNLSNTVNIILNMIVFSLSVISIFPVSFLCLKFSLTQMSETLKTKTFEQNKISMMCSGYILFSPKDDR